MTSAGPDGAGDDVRALAGLVGECLEGDAVSADLAAFLEAGASGGFPTVESLPGSSIAAPAARARRAMEGARNIVAVTTMSMN